MRQIKVIIFTIVILLSMLACSIGGNTNEVAKLKSTIESLKNTIEPAIQAQVETAIPDIPLLTDNSSTGNADPQMLELLGQHGGSSGAIVVDGGIAYIGQGPRVVVVDISAADAPRVLGETKVLPGLVEGISLVGKTIFVVTKYGGLYSFDIKDPTNPKLLGEFYTGKTRMRCHRNCRSKCIYRLQCRRVIDRECVGPGRHERDWARC